MITNSITIRERISTRECLLKLSSSWIPTIMTKWVTRNTSTKRMASKTIQRLMIVKQHTFLSH